MTMIAGLFLCVVPAAAQTCGVLEFTGGGNKITKNVVVNITSLVVSEIDIQGDFEFTMQHGAGEFDNGCPGNSSCLAKFATDNGYENLIVGSVTDGGSGETFALKMRLFDPSTGTFDRTVTEDVHSAPETMLIDIPPLVTELLTGERPKKATEVMAEKEEADVGLDMDVALFDDEEDDDVLVFGIEDDDLGITDLEMSEEEIRARQEEERRRREEEERRAYEEEERRRREEDERRYREEEDRRREEERRRAREEEERVRRDEERRAREEEEERRRRDEERRAREEEEDRRREEERRAREEEDRRRDEEERRYEDEEEDDADILIFDSDASEIVIGEDDEEDDYGRRDERDDRDDYSYDRYEEEDDYDRRDSRRDDDYSYDRYDDEDDRDRRDSRRDDDYSYDRYDDEDDYDRRDSRSDRRYDDEDDYDRRDRYDDYEEEDRYEDYEDEYERYARTGSYDEDDYDDDASDRRDRRDRGRDLDGGSSRGGGASGRFKGEVDKAHVCIKASAGGTYYYQGFFSYGGDIGIHVHRNVLIDMQFKGWTASAYVNSEKKTITLIPLAIGASFKGMRGMVHPFVGGDAVFILYQVHPETGARFAPGFKVRGGIDLKLTEVFGFFAGVNVGFAYAKHIKDVDRRLPETQFLVDGAVGILIQL